MFLNLYNHLYIFSLFLVLIRFSYSLAPTDYGELNTIILQLAGDARLSPPLFPARSLAGTLASKWIISPILPRKSDRRRALQNSRDSQIGLSASAGYRKASGGRASRIAARSAACRSINCSKASRSARRAHGGEL